MVAVNDSNDTGAEQDIIPAKGSGSITPSVGQVLVAGSTPPTTVKLAAVKFELDEEGYLCDPETKARSVQVIAPTPAVNPTAFTYRISFNGGTFDGFDFQAPAGETVDLTDVGRVVSSIGVAMTRGEPGTGVSSMALSGDQASLVVSYDNGNTQTLPIPSLAAAQQSEAAARTYRDQAQTNKEAVDQALAQANVFAQDQVPPYLQQPALNDTYVPRRANVLDDETPGHAAFFGGGNQARLHTAGGNTGLGYFVLKNGAYEGAGSVALGSVAGMAATTGNNLTLVGYYAGGAVTGANEVTHVGSYAGFEVPGAWNTSLGGRAMCGPNVPRVPGASASAAITGAAYTAWLAKTPTGVRNTAVGREALSTLGSGSDNVAVGYEAFGGQGPQLPVSAISVNGTSVTVTIPDASGLIVGEPILFSTPVSGFSSNPPVTWKLYNVTAKTANTFTYEQDPAPVGTYSGGGIVLGGVITGNNNVAVGSSALFNNQRGSANIAIGALALTNADIGSHNIAIGHAALNNQTNGASNVAIGGNAAHGLTTGVNNTFLGRDAGLTATTANKTTTASGQTVLGYQAGQGSTAQSHHIVAVGSNALASANYAVSVGHFAHASGAGSVAIGCDSSNTGASATSANDFVLGTPMHRLKVPGLPTVNPGVGSGYLWNDGGVVKVA